MEIPSNFCPNDVFLNTSRNITWLFKFYFTFYFVILQSEAISDFLLSFCVWHLSVYECHFREKSIICGLKKVTLSHRQNTLQKNCIIQYEYEYVWFMQFSIRLSTQTPTHIFQIEFAIEIPYERGIIFHEFLWSLKIFSRNNF